jgi:hypothetical protein
MNDEVIATLSRHRFRTYILAAGHERERAFALHRWNAEIGASFHLPIQCFEIALRNKLADVLHRQFRRRWFCDPSFLATLSIRSRSRIFQSQRRLAAGHGAAELVAGSSLGVWVALISERHLPLPSVVSDEFRLGAGRVLYLRNRIFHHEPIFKRDLLADYGLIMKLLYQLCPATHNWIRPHCRVPALVRQKP